MRSRDGGHAARFEDRQTAIADIANFFHRLLHIHPFTDGNGLLAMELLSFQARELLGNEGHFLALSTPIESPSPGRTPAT